MSRTQATAFAPASVANVAVGFDCLGFAVEGIGDTVTVTRLDQPLITLEKIAGIDLPLDPQLNTATRGLVKLHRDLKLDFGFNVAITKGIPLSSGLGGSAASSVAALVAANALLPSSLSLAELFSYAVEGEAAASGSYHGDNVAPSLWGGLQLIRSLSPVEVIGLPIPNDLHYVLAHPDFELQTKVARGALSSNLSLKDHVQQSAHLAAFIAACFQNDRALLTRSLIDFVVEPQRAHLIPGFKEVKVAAFKHGALACSISGAGPTVFAFCQHQEQGRQIGQAMTTEFTKAGIKNVNLHFGRLPAQGARLI